MNTNILIAAIVIGVAGLVGTASLVGVALAHEMDTDGGGLYTLTEMRTEYADLTEADYAAVDADELAAASTHGRLPSME